MCRDIEIKFITPSAAFVDASPGRPPYECPIAELSTSSMGNAGDHFRAGQRIDGIVSPACPCYPSHGPWSADLTAWSPSAAELSWRLSTEAMAMQAAACVRGRVFMA